MTDPHFVTFSSSLCTTIIIPNPNRNPTVITHPQIGPIDPQIVTVQILPADTLRSAFCGVPLHAHSLDVAVYERRGAVVAPTTERRR